MKVRAILFTLSMFLLLAAAPVPAPEQPQPQPQQTSGWSYAGCFSTTGSTPCYDVYTHNGGYWMCSACRTTNKPTENKCRLLSSYQLANGRWCS
jgi:hypothetical protein